MHSGSLAHSSETRSIDLVIDTESIPIQGPAHQEKRLRFPHGLLLWQHVLCCTAEK
jgi:hypothetical protein